MPPAARRTPWFEEPIKDSTEKALPAAAKVYYRNIQYG